MNAMRIQMAVVRFAPTPMDLTTAHVALAIDLPLTDTIVVV